jgi:tetratricopeptide (TPR) repeat protein
VAALIVGSYAIHQRQPVSVASTISIDVAGAQPALGVKSTDELVTFWRSRFERDPRDFISVAYLGEAFLRKARETGDVADYERAEAALRTSLGIKPDYSFAVAYLGAALFSKHEFGDALELASRVYAADPRALQALATVGDAQLELGNYPAAAAAYEELAAHDSSPAVLSRRAHLAWLQGQTAAAIEQMKQAAAESATMDLSPENAAWYEYQLGELYFNTGRVDEAALHYEAALQRFDHYYLALAGLGKARAAQGRYDDAVALYTRAVTIIPQPEFLAALGDVYTVLGRSEDAQRQYDTVEVIGTLAALNRVVYNRQLALFYANHDRRTDDALDLATAEIAVRKDIYGYDALAWTLYKAGRTAEAADAITQAMQLGTRDALLSYHAGMIFDRLGDQRRARMLLADALATNSHFDLLQARVAQDTLQRLAGAP